MVKKKKKRALTAEQKQKRKEYVRTRQIVKNRILKAQAEGELLTKEIPPKLSELTSGRQISKELKSMTNWLESPYSTPEGRAEMKEKRFAGYKKAGYKNITETNEQKFNRFMKHMIKKYKDETSDGKKAFHDSDQFAEFFDQLVSEDRVKEKTRLSDLVRMFNRFVG